MIVQSTKLTFPYFIGVVFFNHKYGCQKCLGIGVYDKKEHRRYFADFRQAKRTDEEFRNRRQPIHHKEYSILEELNNADGTPLLDMIKQFPTSDPLHLLEQGVMKRMLNIWTKGTAIYKKKWSKEVVLALSTKISYFNKEKPSDINRSLRAMQFIKFWKATEFRTMLLYFGIVAFKDILEEESYVNFLQLCLAVRLSSCRTYVGQYKSSARQLFSQFCEHFVKIYGSTAVVSNIHNISHISDDIDQFGSLSETSTYPFENFLHSIKSRVQPSKAPIEQISRRLIEMCKDIEEEDINLVMKKADWTPELKYEFKRSNESVFKFIRITPDVYFSVRKTGDKWLLTKSGDIVEMQHAIRIDNSYFISGLPIKHKIDFFVRPYPSHKTDIYLSNGEKNSEKLFEYREIKSKMMCISHNENFVFIPILHSLDECKEFL